MFDGARDAADADDREGTRTPKPRLEILEKDWVGVWKALDTWLAAHRGQVVGLLRMLGKQPPNVDMMTFYQVR